MTDLFLGLVDMGIKAGYLILAVVVLRLLLKNAPKWIRSVLWIMVGVRLVIPFSFDSAFSLIPHSAQAVEKFSVATGMDTDFDAGMSDLTIGTEITAQSTPNNEKTAAETAEAMRIVNALSFVWLAGLFGMLLYLVVSYVRLQKRVSDAVIYRKSNVQVYQSEKVGSPFVLGLFVPRIYLPFHIEKKDMDCIVAHEEAHVARGDHWIKPIGFVILAVYWFHPLVWLAYILLCRDIELACDERVIRTLGTEQKKVYSQALLRCSAKQRIISACPLAFGEVGVKKRIVNVLHYKKPAFWILMVSLILCVVIALCFMTNPKAQEQPQNDAVVTDEKMLTIFAHVKDMMTDTEDKICISSDTDAFPGAFVVMIPEDVYDKDTLQGGENIIITMKDTGEIHDNLPVYKALYIRDNDLQSLEDDLKTEQKQMEEIRNEWEVNTFKDMSLEMESYTATEGDVAFINHSEKELQFGEWFELQRKTDGEWYRLDKNADVAFHQVAYTLPAGETVVKTMSWELLYGELLPGEYRIVTQVTDYRAPGDYDTYYLTDEFEIKTNN